MAINRRSTIIADCVLPLCEKQLHAIAIEGYSNHCSTSGFLRPHYENYAEQIRHSGAFDLSAHGEPQVWLGNIVLVDDACSSTGDLPQTIRTKRHPCLDY